MPNSPNAANAMTDPATCHANFLLWNSPKHSSNYVELTVTHGNMLISNFAAASNHFKMFKSNITLYHFVSLSNWVVGPARGLAKEAAPQLAKITKKKMCTNSDDSCNLCGIQRITTTSLPWSSDFGHQPRDLLTTGGWSALHSQPRNSITRRCACSKKTGNVCNITGISKMRNPVKTPLPESAENTAFINLPCPMIRLKQLGFLYGFSSTGTGPTPLNGNLFLAKTPRQLVKQGASTIEGWDKVGHLMCSSHQIANCWCNSLPGPTTLKRLSSILVIQSWKHLVTCSYFLWIFVDVGVKIYDWYIPVALSDIGSTNVKIHWALYKAMPGPLASGHRPCLIGGIGSV